MTWTTSLIEIGPALTVVLVMSNKLSSVAIGRKARFLIVGDFLLVSFPSEWVNGKGCKLGYGFRTWVTTSNLSFGALSPVAQNPITVLST
jgi:hypothetical protein